MLDPANLNLAVSRYSNKAIADSGLAPIRFTRGHPRFKLRYDLAGIVTVLAPTIEEFRIKNDTQFVDAYRERLDTLDIVEVATEIDKIIRSVDAHGAVMLCFEDVRIGDVCHRQVFAEWWELNTGVPVPELDNPDAPKHKHKTAPKPPPNATLFD